MQLHCRNFSHWHGFHMFFFFAVPSCFEIIIEIKVIDAVYGVFGHGETSDVGSSPTRQHEVNRFPASCGPQDLPADPKII